MAPWFVCLLCKRELTSDPQCPRKDRCGVHVCNPSADMGDRDSQLGRGSLSSHVSHLGEL